ncbi:MAG: hypothetical protein JNM17_37790 [Archangium sp.]|nr:hypothetical protein [Archangium sp.]
MLRSSLFAVLVVLAGCPAPVMMPPPPPPTWAPGTIIPQSRTPNARGFVELRGLIHVHSIYSHDACDGAPHDLNGVYNQPCLADFRLGACASQDDFFFLTDHGDSFRDNEFPDVLLFDQSKGDVLVERGGRATANRLMCPSGSTTLIMAGTETGAMPVGLEAHVGDAGMRDYGDLSDARLDAFKAVNSVNLVAHAEDWSVQQLIDLHLDGFEMFNLHRNALKNGGVAADLVLNYVDKGMLDGFPHPDLFLAAFNLDDDVYMTTWGTVLARGTKRVTTMGSDCHQNTLPAKLQDGERIDSYRRMMGAFSNHLLVRPKTDGTWDDADLKEALRSGRNFGVFEFMGYADGFDFFAREGTGSAVKELGETARLANGGVTLVANTPKVKDLDPAGEQPVVAMILFKAREGGWDEVARVSEGTLEQTVTSAGAYRIEVRIAPKHLRPWGNQRKAWFGAERPWVMSSALYVE